MWGTGLAEGPARGRAAHLGATRTWQRDAGRTRAGALAMPGAGGTLRTSKVEITTKTLGQAPEAVPYGAGVSDRCGWMGRAVVPGGAHGAFLANCAATLCNCQGPVRVGGELGPAGGDPTVRFCQIAQLPYATVWRADVCLVGRAAGVAAGAVGAGTARRAARIAKHDKDPMERRPGGCLAGGAAGTAAATDVLGAGTTPGVMLPAQDGSGHGDGRALKIGGGPGIGEILQRPYGGRPATVKR